MSRRILGCTSTRLDHLQIEAQSNTFQIGNRWRWSGRNPQFKLFLLVNLPKRKWSTRFLSRVGRQQQTSCSSGRASAYIGGQDPLMSQVIYQEDHHESATYSEL